MLTKKQRELLDFITKFIAENNYSPSYREIMAGLNIRSVSTVAQHVDNLVTKGVLRKTDSAIRSLEIVNQTPQQPDLINQKITYYERAGETDKAEILRQAKQLLDS